jgi:Uma2 family endonuclease
MTMEQFLQLPDQESYRYELWQGELVNVDERPLVHSWIRGEFVVRIKLFLEDCILGGEALGGTAIQFGSHTLTRPDLSYWDAEGMKRMDWFSAPVRVIPRLLAQVASESDLPERLAERAEYYLRAGVQVVWIVDRDPFQIHVFEKGQPKRVLRPGDKLDAPTVLPGFSENVSSFVPPVR